MKLPTDEAFEAWWYKEYRTPRWERDLTPTQVQYLIRVYSRSAFAKGYQAGLDAERKG